jgi:TonB family protein
MSAHALSPRPADFLPPSLQPHAIADAAPGSDRRLSFLVSCCIYSTLVAGVAFTAKTAGAIKVSSPVSEPMTLIELRQVVPEQIVPAMMMPFGGGSPLVRTAREDQAPPIQNNTAPENVTTYPTEDLSQTGLKGMDNLATVPLGVPWGTRDGRGDQGEGSQATRPTMLEIEPSAVRVLHSVQPSYPTLARLARVQGPVVLQLTIDAQGVPTDVKVVSSPHTALEGESMRVARLWRFAPATADGHPIAATFKLTLNYVLR